MPWRRNHRGPYCFLVSRPHPKKPGHSTTEWLPGQVDSDDVETDARALLADPRDTIERVHVWSLREECYVMTYR